MLPENDRQKRFPLLAMIETAQDPMTGSRCVRSEDLLNGRRDLVIIHGQQRYRLQCTRTGKLILTK